MDYKKIYNQIMKRAKTRKLTGYKEKHHIKPKCLGGSNTKRNLVELTAKEHFLCHLLLVEIHPKSKGLKYALFLMAIGKRKSKNNKYNINSRTYERLKQDFSKLMKGNKNNFGNKYSQKTKDKMSITRLGKKRSKKAKQNMRNSALGKIKTKEHRENLSKSMTKSIGRIVLQKDLNGILIKEWETGKIASKEIGISYVAINNACRRNFKNSSRKRDINNIGKYTSFGYIWEYK